MSHGSSDKYNRMMPEVAPACSVVYILISCTVQAGTVASRKSMRTCWWARCQMHPAGRDHCVCVSMCCLAEAVNAGEAASYKNEIQSESFRLLLDLAASLVRC